MGPLLKEAEKARLEALATRGLTPSVRRRAQLLLLFDEGLQTREVAIRVGLSPSQTRRWRRRYLVHGFEIFADQTLPPAQPVEEELPVARTIEIERLPATVHQGNHRRELALALFDGTQPTHQMGENHRRLLEVAALMQYLSESGGTDRPAKAGRLSILSNPMAELEPGDQTIVDAILEHQKGGRKRYSKPQIDGMIGETGMEALGLAALLRIAGGLDDSGSQTTEILSIQSQPEELQIRIAGPEAGKDARAARKKGNLWTAITGQAVRIWTERSGRESQVSEALDFLLAKGTPGVEAIDSLAEAGRKVMGYHFAAMIRHEDGTRRGEDIEELHDMRVATRRMRAAFEVFAGGFETKAIKPHLKGLRATGRALGNVRDLDVFMEKARRYLATLPEAERSGLDPLLSGWEQDREESRDAMLRHLDGADYAAFKRKYLSFLTAPGEGALEAGPTTPHLVRDVLPVLVYTRLGAVRAFGPVLESATIEQLHALRIEFKKLRYTLEYFREVLGGEAKALIEEIKLLQDHLGDLNDADVACKILRDFLDDWENRQLMIPIDERDDPEPIVAYLATRHAERHRLMVTFREVWARFDRPEIRAQFAAAVSVL